MKDITELFDFLPHRYPFLLVDRVLELSVGESIRGLKNVTMNENFFVGHFPGHPIMPGVLMVEALAQLSGVLAYETKNTRPADGAAYYLGGTNKTRFKKPVIPGDQLILHSRILADRSRLMKFDCAAFVEEELVCTSEIILMEGVF
ncbi:MAG: 3-hydroxyacyl-ACP dehydratase FabZ [Gammaproteobacteria bacterium]|nr:3-hydroxyacyl-ACP dehydratase FabZ [Gammaproteobacteria bacterium]MCZ6854576.1 3-hydroxyacyl-ACP dehydratase FabZ [Gammaproteobacteria bacterium]